LTNVAKLVNRNHAVVSVSFGILNGVLVVIVAPDRTWLPALAKPSVQHAISGPTLALQFKKNR
jgi:hypothetical protein